MERLYIDLGKHSYWIEIGKGLIHNLNHYMEGADRWLILTDDVVDQLYGQNVYESLKEEFNIRKYVITSGESYKNPTTIVDILNYMVDHQFTRRSKIIALGGGVIGDIAGFCASIYMRGIEYLQVPTTLLSQVDSSVGGKTGVNLPKGKNLVGTFYQPKKVIIDIDFLKTLPTKEILGGVGEILKYGIVHDYNFLTYLEENYEKIFELKENILKYVIYKSCKIKAEIVSKDEKENGLRKILNLGHTIGHALEVVTDFKEYTHGEAVLYGMYYEAQIAHRLGIINKDYYKKIQQLLEKFQINVCKISSHELVKAMKGDKKNQQNKIAFILPTDRQQVKEILLSEEEIISILEL